MVAKGRSAKVGGEDHNCAKLRERDVISILTSRETGVTLATRHGVSPSLISAIRHRKIWKYVHLKKFAA